MTGSGSPAIDLLNGVGATAPAFDRIAKSSLTDSRGVDFLAFRKNLRPNFVKVWFHIGTGLVLLALVLAVFARMEGQDRYYAMLAFLPAAVLIGYLIAFINLFFHEAAHHNIAPNRRLNDFLANLFIGTLVLQDIRQYRRIHFDHHRYLGTTRDTERSYFDPLSPRFLLESLLGVRVLKVVLLREKVSRSVDNGSGGVQKKSMLNFQVLVGLALHASIVGAAVSSHRPFTAVAWIVGVGLLYPFWNAVRQSLEHRSERAHADVDYSAFDHGACNRLFGDGLFAGTFGGAGFNRHLLHHWEPQISYTCLKQVEEFLLDTKAAPALLEYRTTYWKTLRALFGEHNRRTP
jgi:fatty acid desaturase